MVMSSVHEGVHRRVRLSRAERRAQLVEAAAAAFLARGYDGTSVEEVANQAGVTRLIVYRHFDGKDDLYRAVLSSVTDDLRASFDTPTTPPIVATLLAIARAHPDAFRLLWRHARHEPEFAPEASRFRSTAAGYADAIVGQFVTDALLRRWASAAVVDHLLEGICLWLDGGDPRRDEEFAARLRAGARALVSVWVG